MAVAKPTFPLLQRSDPLANGLVIACQFHEGGGATLHDVTGNGNNGTLTNSPAWVAGRSGSALQFNGTNQSVGLLDRNGGYKTSDILTNDISVAGWLYISSAMISGSPIGNDIISKHNGQVSTSAYGFSYSGSNTFCSGIPGGVYSQRFELFIQSGANSYYRTSSKYTTPGWYLGVGVFTTNTGNIYVNGVLDNYPTITLQGCGTTASFPATRNLSTSYQTYIGANPNATAYSASILDSVYVWNRALTADEVRLLYVRTGG